MNEDELFNKYSEEMQKVDPRSVKGLETAMSSMLDSRVTPSLVWSYARRAIAGAKKYGPMPTKKNPAKTKAVLNWHQEELLKELFKREVLEKRKDVAIAGIHKSIVLPLVKLGYIHKGTYKFTGLCRITEKGIAYIGNKGVLEK